MPLDLDAVTLSRIQFAFTIAFHIIFPAFTIGLASWLAVLELRWLMTGREAFRDLYRFWIKVFAISFGLGVVSGIPMSFQFGTNWSGFADFTGDVLGPLIAYEVVTAFTIEAGFLGIMLFGWLRCKPGRRTGRSNRLFVGAQQRPKLRFTRSTSPAMRGRNRNRAPWPFLSARITSKPLMVA